jgi:hypothetical protein
MENWQPSLEEWLAQSGITLSSTITERRSLTEYLPLFCHMARLQPNNS